MTDHDKPVDEMSLDELTAAIREYEQRSYTTTEALHLSRIIARYRQLAGQPFRRMTVRLSFDNMDDSHIDRIVNAIHRELSFMLLIDLHVDIQVVPNTEDNHAT